MDDTRAKELLTAERDRITALLSASTIADDEAHSDDDEPRDSVDGAQGLTFDGVGDAVADGLRDRLGAIDRAERRLTDGTYGTSTRSGEPIPDERLEADPAAELTVAEARDDVSNQY